MCLLAEQTIWYGEQVPPPLLRILQNDGPTSHMQLVFIRRLSLRHDKFVLIWIEQCSPWINLKYNNICYTYIIIHLLRQVTTQPVWWDKSLHMASSNFISLQIIVELVPCTLESHIPQEKKKHTYLLLPAVPKKALECTMFSAFRASGADKDLIRGWTQPVTTWRISLHAPHIPCPVHKNFPYLRQHCRCQ